MSKRFRAILSALWAIGLVVVPGCSQHQLAYKFTERAASGYVSAAHDDLLSLPAPREKIVIAVYKFRDQTGQYKTSAQATTFSTAVTQGATSMVIKALEDSGWFTVIEREALPNLMNERQIIRSTRAQYAAESGGQLPPLPPLLYAGVLLEGGVIGYDTNLITGGAGVAYFGLSGSGQVRCDQMTIYLRLVSTQNGQILKSLSVSKSVLSREIDFGIYRFVRTNRLLEAETGLSTNEPPTMCALEAIEKGVYDLIVDGVLDGLWTLQDPNDMNSATIQERLKERQEAIPQAVSGRTTGLARAVNRTQRAPEPARAPESKQIVREPAPPVSAQPNPATEVNEMESRTDTNSETTPVAEPGPTQVAAQSPGEETEIQNQTVTHSSVDAGQDARSDAAGDRQPLVSTPSTVVERSAEIARLHSDEAQPAHVDELQPTEGTVSDSQAAAVAADAAAEQLDPAAITGSEVTAESETGEDRAPVGKGIEMFERTQASESKFEQDAATRADESGNFKVSLAGQPQSVPATYDEFQEHADAAADERNEPDAARPVIDHQGALIPGELVGKRDEPDMTNQPSSAATDSLVPAPLTSGTPELQEVEPQESAVAPRPQDGEIPAHNSMDESPQKPDSSGDQLPSAEVLAWCLGAASGLVLLLVALHGYRARKRRISYILQ